MPFNVMLLPGAIVVLIGLVTIGIGISNLGEADPQPISTVHLPHDPVIKQGTRNSRIRKGVVLIVAGVVILLFATYMGAIFFGFVP